MKEATEPRVRLCTIKGRVVLNIWLLKHGPHREHCVKGETPRRFSPNLFFSQISLKILFSSFFYFKNFPLFLPFASYRVSSVLVYTSPGWLSPTFLLGLPLLRFSEYFGDIQGQLFLLFFIVRVLC